MLTQKELDALFEEFRQSDEERALVEEISSGLISGIEKILQDKGLDAKVMLVGSAAKQTSLKGGDVDVFIVFSKKYRREEIVKHGLSIGHEVLPSGFEKFAEHPYVTGFVEGHKVDIVPCFAMNLNEKIQSSVDRSPLHEMYVKERLDDSKRKQIVLLKAFMKGINVYGSEVFRSGFSGYVCELLVIELGTFSKVLEFFASSGKRLILHDGNSVNLFDSSLIIVDPVDDRRNAAASVSKKNLARMRILSREFLHDPSSKYFHGELDRSRAEKNRGTSFRILTMPKPDLIDDVLIPQVRRLDRMLMTILEEGGFMPVGSEILVDSRISILIEVERVTVPGFRVHHGPPAESPETRSFLQKWSTTEHFRGPYFLEDRLVVDVRNPYTSLEECVMHNLEGRDIGAHLTPMYGSIKIIDPDDSKMYSGIISSYLHRNILD